MAATTAKQYIKINNKTILEHTLLVFLAHPSISNIVVVLHPDDHIFESLPVAKNERVTSVVGGSERVNSVLSGLEYLRCVSLDNAVNQQFVMVHDAARPCLSHCELDKLIAACIALPSLSLTASVGAILAIPVADTIKRAQYGNPSLIESTVDRSCLWQAQTPQMFRFETLIKAIKSGLTAGVAITDEASAIELSGQTVVLVEGLASNIKVTRPSDLRLAEFYLSDATQA